MSDPLQAAAEAVEAFDGLGGIPEPPADVEAASEAPEPGTAYVLRKGAPDEDVVPSAVMMAVGVNQGELGILDGAGRLVTVYARGEWVRGRWEPEGEGDDASSE